MLSFNTVLAPSFVITAIQRLPIVAAQLSPSVLGQTDTRARLLTAATFAVCKTATISLAEDFSLLPRIMPVKLGKATTANIAATAMVTTSSIRVKPRKARRPLDFRVFRNMTLPQPLGRSTLLQTSPTAPPVTDQRPIPRNGWFGPTLPTLRPCSIYPDRHIVNAPGHSPLDALFRPAALIAVLLAGEALALIIALSTHAPGGRLIQFGLASLAIQWICLSTLCTTYLLRHPLARLSTSTVAWTCLGILLCMTLLVALAAWSLLAIPGNPAEGKTSFILRMLAIALVVGLLTLLTYQNYWRARLLAVRAKQAELEALQARIRPHFLFNTLNTGAALVHQRPADAEQLLLDLADLFRAALAGPREIPLGDELALTRRYLEIESLRFGKRLHVEWQLPGSIPDVATPTLSLQPLVENAIRHGVEPSPDGGTIAINVKPELGSVRITVRNPLPADGTRGITGHQVGLSSVRARIEALTQGKGRVETSSDDGVYTATIVLPTASRP